MQNIIRRMLFAEGLSRHSKNQLVKGFPNLCYLTSNVIVLQPLTQPLPHITLDGPIVLTDSRLVPWGIILVLFKAEMEMSVNSASFPGRRLCGQGLSP